MTRSYTLLPVCVAALTIVFASSCKTYTIPVSSFREQFAEAGTEKTRRVKTEGPYGQVISYNTYPMDYIYCENSVGKKYRFPVGPALVISFRDTNNRRTPFYFDLITVDTAVVAGYQWRAIAPAMLRTVDLGAVRKITIKNSGKRYFYID